MGFGGALYVLVAALNLWVAQLRGSHIRYLQVITALKQSSFTDDY